MKRFIIAIAAFALATIGFAGTASATFPEPEAPTAVHEECTGPGESSEGGIQLPDEKFWNYDIIAGDGDNADGEFHALPAGTYDVIAEYTAKFPQRVKDRSWELTIEDAGDCLVEVTPEEPTFTHPMCVAGEIVPGASVIPEQDGVVYEPAEGGDINHGDVISVSAIPAEGYVFPEDVDDPSTWEFIGVQPGCDGADGSDGKDGSDGADGEDGETVVTEATPVAKVDTIQTTGSTLPKTGVGPEALALVGLGLVALGALATSRRRIAAKLFNR